MYTVYQLGGIIVAELANMNGNCYSKKSTEKHSGVRVKGNPGTNQWLDIRLMSAKEDISKGILSPDIYDCDSSSSSSDSDTCNISYDSFPCSYKSCLSDNSD